MSGTRSANSRRDAHVWLYTHALQSVDVASLLPSAASSPLVKHWCVIVQFLDDDDDRIWLCDLANTSSTFGSGSLQLKGGDRIHYTATPASKRELRKGKTMEQMFYQGTIKTSPNELKAACKAMKHNGEKYDLLNRNCHHCAIELCSKLGLSCRVAK